MINNHKKLYKINLDFWKNYAIIFGQGGNLWIIEYEK